jgi:hypothetical protein
VRAFVDAALADSEAWYAIRPVASWGTAPLPADAAPGERMVTFESQVATPHAANNTAYLRYFPAARRQGAPKRAVVVMAQWNADEGGHVGLCRLLAYFGISAVRLSLPYHDRRMPPDLQRADYIVSSNIGQTLQTCRQAVVDARVAVSWLEEQGYERIGLLGTSLGSCLAMLTGAHEPRVSAMALNHVSPWFADVIWEGLTTVHVRAGLETHVDLPQLRDLWSPISPQTHIARIGQRPTLLVYGLYDLSFPLHLSRDIVQAYRDHGVPIDVRVLPCGHYTTGVAPFKYLDGFYLATFLRKAL